MNQGLLQKTIPIASIGVGILAGLLTAQYIGGIREDLARERAALLKANEKISVLAAAEDLPVGTVLKPADIGVLSVPRVSVGQQAILPDDVELLFGKKIVFSLKKRDPLMWTHIEGGADNLHGLAQLVQPGLRAISLSVGGAEAVSSMVQPNDRVDVLGTFSFPSQKVPGEMETVTLTVLQDVTVLATGQRTARQRSTDRRGLQGSGYSTVTVEVTPREAELLVFAQQIRGRLTLALRNSGDVSFESDLPEIDFKHIEDKLPEYNRYRQMNIRHKRNL